MANPQKENGSTDIANELLEVIYSSNFNAPQLDIIYCLIRYTYGFHRKSHKLSINFISRATKRHKITISKELAKLIDKNVINVEQKSTYSTSRILSLNKNYSTWGVSQNETVSQSETVSQNGTSTVSQNETVGVSQNETKKLKIETKKETKDIHTKSDDFESVCQSVFDYFENCGSKEKFKNEIKFKVNRKNETILKMLEEIYKKYSLKQIKDVIYQAYNNHVEFEWKTKAGKSSKEFYNLKTILKPDKFKKYLEQYEDIEQYEED